MNAGSILEFAAPDIDGVDGLRALALSCTPFLIRGLCDDWPAVLAGRRGAAEALSYVARFDGGLTAEYLSGDRDLQGRYHYGAGPGGFNFKREIMPVRSALKHILDNASGQDNTGYLGSLPADSYFPGFAEENGCRLVARDIRPRLWLGNHSTIACHYDVYDNLACIVAGHRRFTLYPPDAVGDLYIGPIDHTLSGQPVSLAAAALEPSDAYPRFAAAQARAIVVDLGPGDALYIPKLWWHQVEALDRVNILANYWWDGFSAGADSPHTAMMLSMIAIAERPAAERAAWRAYFDHYVFRSAGHPLAHLPEADHGVLGPLANGNYGRIRALVMKILRGG